MNNPEQGHPNTCRICGTHADQPVYRVREMMYGLREEFLYFQCVQCGCLQMMEFPEDMAKFYPEGYLSFASDPARLYRTPVERWARRMRDSYAALGRGFPGRWIDRLYPAPGDLKTLARVPLTRRSRILDVGCGSGTLLYLLHEAGFRNLLGVDPHIDRDRTYGNGLRILRREIHDAEGAWDLVMFHHSFEHMSDPGRVLQSVSKLLAPDGYCLIRIPVVSSFAWENYGVHWVQLDAPRHLFLHSLDSLRTLALKEHFHLEDMVFDSDAFQFWGSEQYRKGIPLRSERSYSVDPAQSMFTREQMEAFQERAGQLNREARGDQAVFYLKKD